MFFRKRQIALLIARIMLLEKSEAQQREFLHTNAVPSTERYVGAD
ncbi:MAG TPA: hypothetical protein VK789_00515 [Bryobacteraceae bacterium]|nr:hypothetical protein [Bryobacteraceae bacterium]